MMRDVLLTEDEILLINKLRARHGFVLAARNNKEQKLRFHNGKRLKFKGHGMMKLPVITPKSYCEINPGEVTPLYFA